LTTISPAAKTPILVEVEPGLTISIFLLFVMVSSRQIQYAGNRLHHPRP